MPSREVPSTVGYVNILGIAHHLFSEVAGLKSPLVEDITPTRNIYHTKQFRVTRKMSRKRIAIVGSGCSGIGALWALKNTNHEVHLYEAESRLGGHTNTVVFEGPDGKKVNVDTGFIVMNTATYRQSDTRSDSQYKLTDLSQQTLLPF
jgi:pyruvate/2-oxoglutarate dehydrogenase complex dihydrolipoamide dehydrogenase (E3) component